MMRTLLSVSVIIASLLTPGWAHAAMLWEKFVGTYMGVAHNSGEEKATRDLQVVITPSQHEKGFKIEWTALVYRDDASIDRRSLAIDFVPGGREGVFAAGMQKDMFGQPVPFDPLKGEPYAWAVIQGETLVVHMLLVLDDGSYQMQSYYRTLTKDGMRLVFNRTSDGKMVTALEADLIKAQ